MRKFKVFTNDGLEYEVHADNVKAAAAKVNLATGARHAIDKVTEVRNG